jgi:hypothetical protein
MPNRVLVLFEKMKAIESEHQSELEAISAAYKVDEISWIGITAVWTILLSQLNAAETQTVLDILALGLDEFNNQPLSIRVGFMTLPKQLYETLRNERGFTLRQDGRTGDHTDSGQ